MAVPRLKQNDNNLYPGKEGTERIREFMNDTNPKDIFSDYCIQLTDVDAELAKLMDEGPLQLTADGQAVPVVTVDNERWAEFAKTWQLQNGDGNISPPLITVRRTEEEVGTLLGNKWTIPNRKHMTTLKVPTFDSGVRGFRLFQVTQPTNIDAIYEVRLIALFKEDTTQMAENFLREYNSRQLYINVKGRYFRTVLEDMSNEDSNEEIESDKYYMRIFKIRVSCSIQRIEDFREVDLPNRIITSAEIANEVVAQVSDNTVSLITATSPTLGPAPLPKLLFGGSGHSNASVSITGLEYYKETNELVLSTFNGEFRVKLGDDSDNVSQFVYDEESQELKLITKKHSYSVDLTQLATDLDTKLATVNFSDESRVLTLRATDGEEFAVTIPAASDGRIDGVIVRLTLTETNVTSLFTSVTETSTQLQVLQGQLNNLVSGAPQGLDTLVGIANQIVVHEQDITGILTTQQEHTQELNNVVHLSGDETIDGNKVFLKDVKADKFIGDGSLLTGIIGNGASVTIEQDLTSNSTTSVPSIAAVNSTIGDKLILTTNDKSNIVSAINELNNKVSNSEYTPLLPSELNPDKQAYANILSERELLIKVINALGGGPTGSTYPLNSALAPMYVSEDNMNVDENGIAWRQQTGNWTTGGNSNYKDGSVRYVGPYQQGTAVYTGYARSFRLYGAKGGIRPTGSVTLSINDATPIQLLTSDSANFFTSADYGSMKKLVITITVLPNNNYIEDDGIDWYDTAPPA